MESGQEFIAKLPSHLLWDVDPASLDADQHAAFLIRRIMDRGDSEEVRQAWSYYGAQRVRDALVQAPALNRKTLSFFANQFQIPSNTFRAWQQPLHWDS
ncbi:MAG: hypothetical protein ABQ298_05885 [Puniceicoccaceae bacterium]